MKLYILLAAIVLFSFFSNDFGLVDIQKTAIILAAGIDKTQNGYTVTAQIAVPKGSDRTTGGTSSVEIDAEGKTVSDCISAIYAKTGWVPKLVFCDLLLLGESAVKEDVFTYLNYFYRNEYMPDSCLLAVCEGSAKELISSQSAIDDASSLAIEKLFSDAAVKSGRVMPNTLKDFAIGYYGVSKSGYLPYVRAVKQDGDQTAEGGQNNSGGGGAQDSKIYSAEQTALFSEGKQVALLSPEETLAFSLLQGKVFTGTFAVSDGDGSPVTLTVLQNKGKVGLKDGTAKLSLALTVRLCCRGVSAPVEGLSSDDVSGEILSAAEETLRGYVAELFDACQKSGCDLLMLKRDLYRASLKQYAEQKDAIPASLRAEIKVSVTSKS